MTVRCIPRRLVLAAFLFLVALPVFGDGAATYIGWAEWQVYSSEDFGLGRKHTSFPLTNLFDGNPATAWVFSGVHNPESGPQRYAIRLLRSEGRQPVFADSIRIMNGYNKSRKLFLRNNRITELQIYKQDQLVKTVSLKDSMGWHKISIPRQPVDYLELRFTKFNKGRDDDVCVSEIALYDRGRRIDLRMPAAVEYSEGSSLDCGCCQTSRMINRSGKRLSTISFMWSEWSPNGRYVAGSDQVGEDSNRFVIYDAQNRKLLMRRSTDEVRGIRWKGNHSVVVDMAEYNPKTEKERIYSKTFRIRRR